MERCKKCGSAEFQHKWFSSRYECRNCGYVDYSEEIKRKAFVVAGSPGLAQLLSALFRR
jgi:transcription initiation factor TFIIIB Brf1 subunit/transcription initiation factor TFIIB